MEEGVKAKLALEAKACTPAVEKVIEANTLLSGIGFESGGLAGAHAIHNGFTVLEECHKMYHGEKVAFGTITQLVLENASEDQLYEVISFCIELGLPVTLKELGIAHPTKEKIMAVAEAASAPEDTIHNMPFPVTAETVLRSNYGRRCLRKILSGRIIFLLLEPASPRPARGLFSVSALRIPPLWGIIHLKITSFLRKRIVDTK